MLFRPLIESLPPSLQEPGVESLLALEGLNGYDQLEITCHHVVGLLRSYRSIFTVSQERHEDFDVLCEGLIDWLETEIAPLRFGRSN